MLRDNGRRAAYDGLHTDGPDFTGAGRWRGEADIDEWFAEWFKRQGWAPPAPPAYAAAGKPVSPALLLGN